MIEECVPATSAARWINRVSPLGKLLMWNYNPCSLSGTMSLLLLPVPCCDAEEEFFDNRCNGRKRPPHPKEVVPA